MSINENHARHDENDVTWNMAIGETSQSECDGDEWYETHKGRGELLDALRAIGALADEWLEEANDHEFSLEYRLTAARRANEVKATLDKL